MFDALDRNAETSRTHNPVAGRHRADTGRRPARSLRLTFAALAAAAVTAGGSFADDPSSASTDDEERHVGHMVPLFPSAADGARQGFVRVINHSDESGEVRIDAIDDTGDSFGPLMLAVEAEQTVHFNSTHLENGDPAKGWSTGTGPGQGDWRLTLSSELDIEVLSYIRLLQSGFVTSMHDTAPVVADDHGHSDDGHGHSDDDEDADHAYRIVIFNPGSNTGQVSLLRVINTGDESTDVTVSGVDDRGHESTGSVTMSVAAGAARTVSAQDLEAGGEGLDGALGDGDGKWQLSVRSHAPVTVMSLLRSPTGHLTNLSTVPTHSDGHGHHMVPLFPAADDSFGRQGFVRVINHASEAGAVEIHAFDDSGASSDRSRCRWLLTRPPPLTRTTSSSAIPARV